MKINANWVVIKVPVTGEGFNVFNPAPGKFGRIGHRRKKSKRHDEGMSAQFSSPSCYIPSLCLLDPVDPPDKSLAARMGWEKGCESRKP